MDRTVYSVHCMSGHVMEVITGTELEQKCKERADKGLLDALCLGPDECPECIEDDRERQRRTANTCSNAGCMFMSFIDEDDPCNKGCKAWLVLDSIQDSPYKGQLRGLPANV